MIEEEEEEETRRSGVDEYKRPVVDAKQTCTNTAAQDGRDKGTAISQRVEISPSVTEERFN